MEYDNNRTESRLKGALSEKKYIENSTETNGNMDNNTAFSYENNLFLVARIMSAIYSFTQG